MKKLFVLFMFIAQFCNAQTTSTHVVSQTQESFEFTSGRWDLISTQNSAKDITLYKDGTIIVSCADCKEMIFKQSNKPQVSEDKVKKLLLFISEIQNEKLEKYIFEVYFNSITRKVIACILVKDNKMIIFKIEESEIQKS